MQLVDNTINIATNKTLKMFITVLKENLLLGSM